jgi:hypothetical protein
VPKSLYTIQFEREKKNWPFSQVYFWQGTTARFFHLYDLMKFQQLQNVVHMETDSILLDTEYLKGLNQRQGIQLAFPLQADNVGCASILWVRNYKSLEPFLEFVLSRWQAAEIDDMSLLGEYARYPGVYKLPTWSNHTGFAGYIFDAQSFGRYYLGTDARNMRLPFSKRGIGDNRDGAITGNFQEEDLHWGVIVANTKVTLTGTTLEGRFNLANLHLHGKSIPKSLHTFRRRLKRGFAGERNICWHIGRIDFRVVLERAYSFLNRRVFLKKENTERIFR